MSETTEQTSVDAPESGAATTATVSNKVQREFIAEYPKTQEEVDGMFKYPPVPIYSALPERKLVLSWKILSMRTVTNSRIANAVMDVIWECTGRDTDGNEGKYVSTTTFDTNKLNSEDLIDLSKLTEDMVVYWLKDSFNERYMDHIHAQITNDINHRKSLVMEFTENKLPWKT